MSDPLRDLMGELAGEQPAVADWPGRVRGLVVRRRRRQRVLTAAAVAALLAVGGTGVLLAAEQPRPDSLVAAPDPSTSPSPVATASASAPAPAPEPSAAATSSPPAAEPEPTAETAPSAAPPPPPPASPAPSFPPSGTQVIEISASGRPDRPMVGQEWVLDITVTGSADMPYLQEPCVKGEPCRYVATSCVPRDSSYSPPPPRPQTLERTFRHTFTTPGRHEVRLEASEACSYYQGGDELTLVVQVDEAPQPPSPSPSPSPEPSPAASP